MFKRDTKGHFIINIFVFFTLFNLLLVSLFNVNVVSADTPSATFKDTPNNIPFVAFVTDRNNQHILQYFQTSKSVRCVFIRDPNANKNRFAVVSETPFTVGFSSVSAESITMHNAATVNYQDVTYYYDAVGWNYEFSYVSEIYSPVVEDSVLSSANAQAQRYVYWTYGAGAVPEGDVIEFGQLKIGFETNIAYSGGNSNAWRKNRDTIYFDRYDTLGNDLFGYNIELQAIPYSVEGSSQQNIIAQGINDYVFDTVKVGQLGYWSPGQGSIDFTWEFITDRFSPIWWSNYEDNWSLTGWYISEHWYRVGWAYRARLLDNEENVLIDWQWIYNGTSIDGEDVNNIVNNNGLTPELVNSINNINNNNNTTNNNTYNNQVINYYDSDQESDGSWLEALLNGIFSTLGNLIDLIKGLFHDILEGLWDLIKTLGVNLIDFFSNIIDNIVDLFSQIDLTLPQFETPEVEGDDWFKDLMTQFVGLFTDNGIGFVIFIPLILFLIGVLF